MNNQLKNKPNSKYNLEERTAKFGEEVIELVKKLSFSPINKRMIEQVVASAGSVGANYCEANEAESKKDFSHKIGICKKETKETKHWLRLLLKANPQCFQAIKRINQEAQELLLIFSAIVKTCRKPKSLKIGKWTFNENWKLENEN